MLSTIASLQFAIFVLWEILTKELIDEEEITNISTKSFKYSRKFILLQILLVWTK